MVMPKGATFQEQIRHVMSAIGGVGAASSHQATPASQPVQKATINKRTQKHDAPSVSLYNSLLRVNGQRALARGHGYHHLEPANMSKYAKVPQVVISASPAQHRPTPAKAVHKPAVPLPVHTHVVNGHLRPAYSTKNTKKSIYNMNNNNAHGVRMARHMYEGQHVSNLISKHEASKHPDPPSAPPAPSALLLAHATKAVNRAKNRNVKSNHELRKEFSFVLPPSTPTLAPFLLPKTTPKLNRVTNNDRRNSRHFLQLTPEEKAEVERLARQQFDQALGPKEAKASVNAVRRNNHVVTNPIRSNKNKNHGSGRNAHHVGTDADMELLRQRREAHALMEASQRHMAEREALQRAITAASGKPSTVAKRGWRVSRYPSDAKKRQLRKRTAGPAPQKQVVVPEKRESLYTQLTSAVVPYAQRALQRINPRHLLGGVGRRVQTVKDGNHEHIMIDSNENVFDNAVNEQPWLHETNVQSPADIHKQRIAHHS